MATVKVSALRQKGLGRLRSLNNLGISARSAAVSGIVVLLAFAFAGTALDVILYRSLLVDVDDATAARVHNIVEAIQSNSADELQRELSTTNHHVVATQLIAPDGKVVERAVLAPETPILPVSEFDLQLRRGIPDDAVPADDMRLSGQKGPPHPASTP